MPAWGRRGSYVGVTTTVATLVAIGVITDCSRDLIPPPEFNDLAAYRARFLARAARQGVRWRTTDDEPFAEAARLGRPVMVFAGTSASQAARQFDDAVFTNPEVWARLNRDFVCVRLDYSTEPEWRGAFIPVLRNSVGADMGYVVWFFKPNGQLLTWIGRRAWDDRPDFNDFLGRLSEVTREFAATPADAWTQSESEQRSELAALAQTASQALPDMDRFFSSLGRQGTFFSWQAGRYRALLQSGLFADASLLLTRDLSTPRTDLVDGGLFRLGSGLNPALVEFDKSATANAEMAAVLARAYRATGDPLYEYWYRRTVESLSSQFMAGRLWSSYVENPVAQDGRSLRNSFGAAAIRTELGAVARACVGELGLDPRKNPMMAPYLATPDRTLDDRDRLAEVVAELRRAREDVGLALAEDDVLDSSGIVVARTLEAALVMGDAETRRLALGWARRLRDFRAGTDEVIHSTVGRGLGRKWLGDFAAYCDAMLMAYTASGEAEFLLDGERVLHRALELFRRDDAVVSVAGSHAQVGPLSLQTPAVVDVGAPPALAVFMTVCFRYGAVLDDAGLRGFAVGIAERFSSLANSEPYAFPSFLCAAQEVMLTGCVVVLEAAAFNKALGRLETVLLLGEPSRLDPGSGRALRYVRTEVAVVEG